MYRLRVDLERETVSTPSGEAPLLAGMRLQASLTLEYRRLYQWAFEPVAGLTGRPL
jgi:membrane fusion protein